MSQTNNLLCDEITRQPAVFPVLVVAWTMLTLSVAFWLSPQADYRAVVVAQINEATSVQYIFAEKSWIHGCEAGASELAASINASCEGCTVTSSCTRRPNESLGQWSASSTNNLATLVFDAGLATFRSSNGTALTLCNSSRRAIEISTSSATCFEGKTLADNKPQLTAMLLLIPTAIISLMVLIIGLTISQRRAMGEAERVTTGHRQATAIVTALADLFAICSAWLIIVLGGNGETTNPDFQNAFSNQVIFATCLMFFWLHFIKDHYRTRVTLYTELSHVTKLMAILALLHTTLVTLTNDVAPATPALFWATCLSTVFSFRYLLRVLLDTNKIWRRPALIIGRGGNAEAARRALVSDFTLGYKTLRLTPTNTSAQDSDICELDNLASDIHRAQAVASKVKIVAALDSLQSTEAQKALTSLLALNRHIDVIPSLRGLPALGADVSQFFGHELIMLSIQNKLAKRPQRIFKRSFDIIVSSLLLILLSPVLAYLAVRIRSDGNAVFFRQDRVGRGGNAFKCIKFRSMFVDAEARLETMLRDNPDLQEEWNRNFKLANDPRVTKIGRTIRKYSLDELPQLFNVLKGEMSLVGPRPLLFNELERYGDAVEVYGLVSPGITGVWQVSGRSDTSFEQRREMDEWYIRNWSLYYDLSCLLRTIGVVLGNKGAY